MIYFLLILTLSLSTIHTNTFLFPFPFLFLSTSHTVSFLVNFKNIHIFLVDTVIDLQFVQFVQFFFQFPLIPIFPLEENPQKSPKKNCTLPPSFYPFILYLFRRQLEHSPFPTRLILTPFDKIREERRWFNHSLPPKRLQSGLYGHIYLLSFDQTK